jgi:Domain of unknown function (DUF4129)
VPERGRLAVTAAFAVVALLALVALASRSGAILGGGASDGPEPSEGLVDYVFTFGVALMAGLMAATAWAMRPSRRFTQDRSFALGPSLLALVLVFGIVALALTQLDDLDIGGGARGGGDAAQTSGPPRVEPAQPRPAAEDPSRPSMRWGALLVVAGIGAAGLAGVFVRRSVRRRAGTRLLSEVALVEELAATVDDALADLDSEPDARRAVIAAYARMERALAAHGLGRHTAEAPLEYLTRISPALSTSRRLVFELSHLYERARFSAHEIDREMKADAIATLAALRDELAAAA